MPFSLLCLSQKWQILGIATAGNKRFNSYRGIMEMMDGKEKFEKWFRKTLKEGIKKDKEILEALA